MLLCGVTSVSYTHLIKASERKERVLEILKRMNLSHRAKHFPQQLSGGQQQRVAIALSLIHIYSSNISSVHCGNAVMWRKPKNVTM